MTLVPNLKDDDTYSSLFQNQYAVQKKWSERFWESNERGSSNQAILTEAPVYNL